MKAPLRILNRIYEYDFLFDHCIIDNDELEIVASKEKVLIIKESQYAYTTKATQWVINMPWTTIQYLLEKNFLYLYRKNRLGKVIRKF